jgi:7-cyano-7-deazaguanine reductase
MIELFDNPAPGRDYLIRHMFPEFTSVCPKTGQPDFATIELEYIADAKCIELKSLKLYYQSFRNQGIFYEAVVNRMLDDLAGATVPRWMRITGSFNVRGGISSVIIAETGALPNRRHGEDQTTSSRP